MWMCDGHWGCVGNVYESYHRYPLSLAEPTSHYATRTLLSAQARQRLQYPSHPDIITPAVTPRSIFPLPLQCFRLLGHIYTLFYFVHRLFHRTFNRQQFSAFVTALCSFVHTRRPCYRQSLPVVPHQPSNPLYPAHLSFARSFDSLLVCQ